jgi:hypothetical protein
MYFLLNTIANLALIGGKNSRFFIGILEGKQENGNQESTKPFAPNKNLFALLFFLTSLFVD